MRADVNPIFPRRFPANALAALALGACLLIVGIAVRVRLAPAVQQFYFARYAVGDLPARLLAGQKIGNRPLDTRQHIRVALLDGQPATFARRRGKPDVRVVMMDPIRFDGWLRKYVYERQSLARWLAAPLCGGGFLALWLFALGVRADARHNRRARNGVRLRGPEMLRPLAFNRQVNGDGFRIWLRNNRTLLERPRAEKSRCVRILKRHENNHISAMADPGGGKTSLCFQILDQVQERGETAIVYDPHMQFTPRYYTPDRGDMIPNPLDARGCSWSPSDEIDRTDYALAMAQAMAQAACLFPGKAGDRNWFFVYSCRLIWAYLIVEYGPDAKQMAHLLRHAEPLIDIMVEGTEMEVMLSHNAAQQRAGIVSELSKIAFSLDQIPERSEGRPHLILREWVKHRRGWLFFTNTQSTRDGLRPIQSLMLDWLIMCLLSEGERKDLLPTFALFDELQTLQRLDQLVALLTEGRKSLRVMYCIQGRSQLKELYGELNEVLLSAPYTKISMRTTEPEAGEWLSKTAGDVEMLVARESRQAGQVLKGVSYSVQPEIRRLLLPSEFSGLDDLHGYLKYGNYIVELRLPIMPKVQIAEKFIPRTGQAVTAKPIPTMEGLELAAAERAAKKKEREAESEQRREEAEIARRAAERKETIEMMQKLIEMMQSGSKRKRAAPKPKAETDALSFWAAGGE